jgi:hypothetical protein
MSWETLFFLLLSTTLTINRITYGNKIPQKRMLMSSQRHYPNIKKTVVSIQLRFPQNNPPNNNSVLYYSKHQCFLICSDRYLVECTQILTSAFCHDVIACALPLLMCIQKNNTLLASQPAFPHYLHVYPKYTIHTK